MSVPLQLMLLLNAIEVESMNNIFRSACAVTVIMAATVVQAGNTLRFENYMPANSLSTVRFSCLEADEVRVEYQSSLRASGGRNASINALSAGGVTASAEILSQINRAADGANISGVSVGCASTGVRVMVELYRPASAPSESDCLCDNNAFLFVYLHKDAVSFTME